MRITNEAMIGAIKKLGPYKSDIAKELGCDTRTITARMEKVPEVMAAWEDGEMAIVDSVTEAGQNAD